MKVIVLGSGVIGVTNAYYLAKAGHEVVVIDRQEGAALETSFANAGEVSPGYSAPWAAPGIPLKAIKWMFERHSPLIIRPKLDLFQWQWMLSMLRNCTAERYDLNKGRMLRLANYSHTVLQELRAETGIAYDQRTQGTLQVFRTAQQIDHAAEDIEILKRFDVPFEVLDRKACIAAEPGLAAAGDKIAGGLRLPDDETGDCFKFTTALAERARDLGVAFHYGTAIERLVRYGDRIVGVDTDKGHFRGDAVVMALGSYSRRLLRPLGIKIPVYPVKGYSITVPIVNADKAPVSTVMDETHKVAITRLGERIRVAGMAELAGFDLSLRPARQETVEFVVSDLFPGAGDIGRAEFWCGLRPMTPDGTPILGPTAINNLFLNTGHGTLGWTMACGSGRLLADLVSARQPEIDVAGLTIDRYRPEMVGTRPKLKLREA
ncbi:MAG: D-amino acid dehydrogenase [Azospirillaceae bacterium]|nr:D-amino acid dehydrogenase [Azospirillaceae bacterium]